MKEIFELLPSLKNMTFDAQMDALCRMCIAHVLNGGEYIGLYETAIVYLGGVD